MPYFGTYDNQYQWVIFGCGRSYAGWGDATAAAIANHAASGCKKCRRYQRRMLAAFKRIAK